MMNLKPVVIFCLLMLLGCQTGKVRVVGCHLSDHQRSIEKKAEIFAQQPRLKVLALLGSTSFQGENLGYQASWRELKAKLPEELDQYDVIYGSGRGALIATLAMIESSDDTQLDEKLSRIDRHMYGAGSEPLESYRSMQRLLESQDKEGKTRLNTLQQEAQKGRLLIVGTVSLTTGRGQLVDLTSTAQKPGSNQQLACTAAALLASASYPVFFPPAEIDSVYYMDGNAARTPLTEFLRDAWIGESRYKHLTVIRLGISDGQSHQSDEIREIEIIQNSAVQGSMSDLYETAYPLVEFR